MEIGRSDEISSHFVSKRGIKNEINFRAAARRPDWDLRQADAEEGESRHRSGQRSRCLCIDA